MLCLPLALTGFAVTGEEGKFPPGNEIVAHVDGDHYVRYLSDKNRAEIYKEQIETATKAADRFSDKMKALRKQKAEEKALDE